MHGTKSTIVLVVALAALLGYIYFVDRNQPVGDSETKEKVFAEITADDIEEIRIKSADGETSRVEKSDGRWTIVEPVKADADTNELSSIATSLSSLDIERVVEEDAADLAQYGLEPARVEVAFRKKGDKEPRRVLLGEKTPTGGDLYARLPDQKRVFLINSYVDTTFNKNTFALRDKNILKIERDKVTAIELSSGGSAFEFAKSGGDWKIVKPIAGRGDYGPIEGIVERLASAQMQSIAAPEASDLAPFGLDRPTATMTAVSGSSRATLTLGRTENALVFAKDASRPMIFTVAPTLKDDVFKELAEYRRKDLFDSRSFTATRVEVQRGSETVVLEKAKDKEGKEIWRNGAGKDVDSATAEDLLSRLTGLRASTFESAVHSSLKAPVATATVRYDENKMESVTFGRSGSDVFASRPDEPGSAKLEASALDEMLKALDAVK